MTGAHSTSYLCLATGGGCRRRLGLREQLYKVVRNQSRLVSFANLRKERRRRGREGGEGGEGKRRRGGGEEGREGRRERREGGEKT